MEKKSLGIIVIALLLIGAGWGLHWLTAKSSKSTETASVEGKATIVDVDAVVNNPEKFAGFIGVEGTIAEVDEKNLSFTLGCEDACVVMPVKFRGRAPKEGTDVIAYGEVKKTERAKYIFVAQEIQAK